MPSLQELFEKYDLYEKNKCRKFEDKERELLLWYVRIIEFLHEASIKLEGEKYPAVCALLIDQILSDLE